MIKKCSLLLIISLIFLTCAKADKIFQINREIQLNYNLKDLQSKTLVVLLYDNKTTKEQINNIEVLRESFSEAGYSTLTVRGDFKALLGREVLPLAHKFFAAIKSESYCDQVLFCGFARGGTFALKYAESYRDECAAVMMLPGYYLPVKPLNGLNIYSRIGSKDDLLQYKDRLYSAITKHKGVVDSGITEGSGRDFKVDWSGVAKWLKNIKLDSEKVAPEKEYLVLNFAVRRGGPSKLSIKNKEKYRQVQLRNWQLLKWDDKYLAFLEALKKVDSVADRLRLAENCKKAGLEVCAEYMYRQVLNLKANVFTKDKDYKRALKSWLELNDQRITPGVYGLPLKGETYPVVDKTGHHRIKHWAAEAFDFVYKKNGKAFKGTGLRLDDHYIWGAPVVAIADGIILSAKDHNPDVRVGMSGGFYNANSIMLGLPNGVFADYGHLQKGSIKVKVGQRVKKGQVLALVGNSGASGAPHLHFAIQDIEGFGLKGLFNFEERKDNKWTLKKASLIVEGLYIKPSKD